MMFLWFVVGIVTLVLLSPNGSTTTWAFVIPQVTEQPFSQKLSWIPTNKPLSSSLSLQQRSFPHRIRHIETTIPCGVSSSSSSSTSSQEVEKVDTVVKDSSSSSTTSSQPKSKNDDDDENIQPIEWKFRGHSCYAEIAKSSSSKASTPSSPKVFSFELPSFFSNDNNRLSLSPSKSLDVILIHGFGCSTTYYRETRKALTSAGHTVHSIDLLGQGKSSKPTRLRTTNDDTHNNIYYSIDLWAEQITDYAKRYIKNSSNGIVLVGNSLGSVVALSAATGDWSTETTTSQLSSSEQKKKQSVPPPLKNVRGLCLFNCGIGMNTRNFLKTIESKPTRVVVTAIFDLLDQLVFDNEALLTFAVTNFVSKDTLRNALVGLYSCADDPQSRVDDELVSSFVDPVLKDDPADVVDVIRQIYTNDGGPTPMELHNQYPTILQSIPIHLIWGDQDNVTPLNGPVGKFYTGLANTNNDDESDSDDDNSNNGSATKKNNVSLQVINAGHIPFDERPECNQGLVDWIQKSVL